MKYVDLIQKTKNDAFPDQELIRKKVYRKRSFAVRMLIFGISSALLFAIVLSALLIRLIPEEEGKVLITGSVNVIKSIAASNKNAFSIDKDSALTVTTTEEVSVDELKARLQVTPQVDFKLTKTGNCKYRMTFPEELTENTLYNILAVYNDKPVYRWAFQTENVFKVTNVYPQNDQHVSVDSAIEVTFSHADVKGFESAFKIEPAVEGSFVNYGRTWAFVPSRQMAPATLYTVTIDTQVNGPDGAALEEEAVFSFRTEFEDSYAYMIHRQGEIADTFLVDESPIAAIAYGGEISQKVKATVYRLQDNEAFIEAHKNYVRSGYVSGSILDLQAPVAAEFEVALILVDDYQYNGKTAFIHYPEPLGQGYYYAEISIGNWKVYQLLQSTDLAVYSISANGAYTVWVNNAMTGKAVENAEIYLDGKKKSTTNRYGFASITGPSREDEVRFLTVNNGDYPYVIAVNGKAVDPEISAQEKYFSYITTNSSLYKTTAKVGVFGVVLPRNKGKIPESIVLRSGFSEDVTVYPDSNGAFTAELNIENTALSGDVITMLCDGMQLDSVWIQIADYELPTYVVSVTTDRSAYTEGETIYASATVTYPDGTPAPGVSVSGDINGVTDENGYLIAEILVSSADDYSYGDNAPRVCSVYCSVDEELGYSVTATAHYAVFNGDRYLKAEYKQNSLKINTCSFNKEALYDIHSDSLYSAVYANDHYIGDAVSADLLAEVHRIRYEKTPSGSTYDPIGKEVLHRWEYTEVDELVETVELKTTNGQIDWRCNYSDSEDERYYVILKTADVYAPSVIRCELFEDPFSAGEYGAGAYYVKADHQEVDIGDEVRLTVLDSHTGKAASGGSVFYTVVGSEMIDHYYGCTTGMELEFLKKYAPGVEVYGAYFDGEHIFDLGAEYLYYDLAKSALNITVESDAEQYQPGDEVSATVKVTDKNGDPVSAVLYVSVVDRALYLLSNNADDPLYDLYDRYGYSEVYVTTSYRHFGSEFLPAGEGGGDGGNSRGDFDDTPYYDMIKTNRKGIAELTFKLPDSVTEWKMVVKAFTDEAEAAVTVYDVTSTLDYFSTVVVGEQLKTVDDCTIAVKSDGRSLQADSVCTYTVGLTDRDGNEVASKTAMAKRSQYTYLNFGPLDAGLYTVYVQSECDSYRDSIIKSFEVSAGYQSVRVNQSLELQANSSLQLKPTQGNVLITAVDQEYAFWQEAMHRLASNGGERVDQMLGAYMAENYYVTGTWMDPEKLDLNLLQPYYSGSGLMLFADSEYADLRVAAKFAAAMPNGCRREELINQFEYYLNDRYAARVDILTAYFGLAALGEPIMGDLQSIYDTVTDLSTEEAAYLALAFAYGGDYDTAKYLYDQQIKPYVKQTEETAYVEYDGVVDDNLTGLTSILANRLSLELAEPLVRYLIDHDSETTLLSLDLITYLNNRVLDLSGKNIFTLKTADGENKTYTYPKGTVLTVELTKDQASSIMLNPIEGNTVLDISYMGDLQELSKNGKGTVISGVEHESTVKRGGVTTVVVPVSFVEQYQNGNVTITLPAGLHLAKGRIHCGTYGYDIMTGYDRNKFTCALHKEANYIILTLRGSIPGDYVIEPIIVGNTSGGDYYMTDPIQISVIE